MSELQIYFAAAIRGDASGDIARRVDLLETIGNVLTKHMASPANVDLGFHSDREIHDHDQQLLAASDVFIADLASPSTGTGYMAARAVAAGKPVLCLYRAGQQPSAMIAGCPQIATRFHEDDAGFARHVRAFLLDHAAALVHRVTWRAPKIFVAGPPGSGKGTLGKRLAVLTGAAHVSTGELLRELIARDDGHPHAAAIARCMAAGELVPAAIMRDIVLERVRRPDCRMFGVILDGYPPSREDLANLRAHDFTPDLVFFLECDDATSVARQVARKARSTDTAETARERVAVFHRADAGYEALATSWFPDAVVVRVDAEQSPQAVESFALECLHNLFGNPQRERSYFPLPPYRTELVRSTRVHFHVDAKDIAAVRAIARDIYVRDSRAQGQLKLYPIDSLQLGPQIPKLPVYRRMPNFHPITRSDTEAFITGRLGDGDMQLMKTVIAATRERGGMAELEEYVGEWTLGTTNEITADSSYAPLSLDLAELAEFSPLLLSPIPTLELHHGFDVPKHDHPTPPLALAELIEACAAGGLVNGGWFIFKNAEHWAYRSNEFATEAVEAGTARLFAQARTLRTILEARGLEVPISFSLEKVHGIWVK